MQKSLPVPSEAPASDTTPLYALAQKLQAYGLASSGLPNLYLRFEPMARFSEQAPGAGHRGPAEVGVLATWRTRSLHGGDVDCVMAMPRAQALALMRACKAEGLWVVNNVRATEASQA